MMPAPEKLAEWARCSCTAMKAPDDKPETELCPFWVLYDSSGTIFELTLTTIENLLGDLAMEPSDMLLYSSIGNRDALATKRAKSTKPERGLSLSVSELWLSLPPTMFVNPVRSCDTIWLAADF